jgi:hypothetical protein
VASEGRAENSRIMMNMNIALDSLDNITTVMAAPARNVSIVIKKVGNTMAVQKNRLAHMEQELLLTEISSINSGDSAYNVQNNIS